MANKKKVDLRNEMDRLMTPEAIKELKPIMTPTVQQFLLRYQDLRDTDIIRQLSETIAPIQTILEKLSTGQEALIQDLSDIKTDLGHVKCDIIGIRQQVKSVRENYEKLEIRQLNIQEQVEDINYRTNDHRMWTIRLLIVVISAILACTTFFFLFPWVHQYWESK
jgi:hypothetical protein